MKRVIIVMVLCLAAHAGAEQLAAPAHGAPQEPQPVLSADSSWAGVMVIVILGMFLMALGVGIVVRLNAPPEELPAPTHHDEHGH